MAPNLEAEAGRSGWPRRVSVNSCCCQPKASLATGNEDRFKLPIIMILAMKFHALLPSHTLRTALLLLLGCLAAEGMSRPSVASPVPRSQPSLPLLPFVISQGVGDGQPASIRSNQPTQPYQSSQSRAGLGDALYTLNVIHYTGDCPGDSIPTLDNVSFRSETLPPAPFQRVRIVNTRTGGYTDREYDQRRVRSEPFSMGWKGSHSGRFLALEKGGNTLDYVISNRQTGKGETGRFTITMDVKEQTRERDFQSVDQIKYCQGERDKTYGKTSIYDCREGFYFKEKVGLCPDGSKQTITRRKIYN